MPTHCWKCLTPLFFSVLTIVTVGITTVAVCAAFTWLTVNHFFHSSAWVVGLMIGILVFTIAVLCFAIYASLCGKNCAKFVLGAVYVVYAGALLGLGLFLASRSHRISFVDLAADLWSANEATWARGVEKTFNCTCWSLSKCLPRETPPPNASDTCEATLRRILDGTWPAITGVAIALAILMLAGASVAFRYCCIHREKQTVVYQFPALLDTYDNFD
jgi:hypothetical protein